VVLMNGGLRSNPSATGGPLCSRTPTTSLMRQRSRATSGGSDSHHLGNRPALGQGLFGCELRKSSTTVPAGNPGNGA
jgi:hypothetical protein